jgi:JAB1/Mov34/MPN/PAD-1 ubiquitin protease
MSDRSRCAAASGGRVCNRPHLGCGAANPHRPQKGAGPPGGTRWNSLHVHVVNVSVGSVLRTDSSTSPCTQDRVEASPEQMARCSAKAERFSNETGTLTRVVGWYHSHPHITVLPSHVDIRTQAMYQMLDPSFIGLIISTFNEVGLAVLVSCQDSMLELHAHLTPQTRSRVHSARWPVCCRTRRCTSRRCKSQRFNRCPQPLSHPRCLPSMQRISSRPWQPQQQVLKSLKRSSTSG